MLCLVAGCSGAGDRAAPPVDGHLFTRLPSTYTGVRFENRLTDTRALNVFTYRNYYNGGGVALGDLTGDGLPEIVLTSNQGGTRLYLNEGKFRFRDVTEAAGLKSKGWTTGVALADVNGDGRLDIYICHAGLGDSKLRANELYINQGLNAHGVPTFLEQAAAYGVADTGYSTQAGFFDYDRDGRLDLLIVDAEGAPLLLHNEGPSNHFLMLRCLDRAGKSDALGARITLKIGSLTQLREVRSAGTYLSCDAPTIHFGCGSQAQADSLTIRWPDGKTSAFSAIATDHFYTIREGRDALSEP